MTVDQRETLVTDAPSEWAVEALRRVDRAGDAQLSDAMGERIAQAIAARRQSVVSDGDASRFFWPSVRPRWAFGVVAACALAVAVVFATQPATDVGGIREVSASNEPVNVVFSSRATGTVMPQSGVRVVGENAIEVLRGVAWFRVAKRAAGERFVVRAGSVEVEVVGTVFSVGHVGADDVEVKVVEGAVRVTDGGRGAVSVSGGQTWRRSVRGDATHAGDFNVEAPSRKDAKPETTSVGVSTPWRQVPATTKTRRANPARRADPPTFARALSRLAAGEVDAAASEYRRLANRRDSDAETALLMLARLEATHRKRPDRALQVLAEMARRFPAGALAAERTAAEVESLKMTSVKVQ
ncbi:MAG: FecR domain-containing protein [Deltaproteobacteria bacterium]|nr:FecR domain-containing protein [Deltaproteobacteria bacterium]